MTSRRFTQSQMVDRPSYPAHRFSEVVPRLEALKVASALNQEKTEYRQGQYLQELVKRKYKGEVAEEQVKLIQESFATLNKKIGELHDRLPRVPIVKKRLAKDPVLVVVDDDTDFEEDEIEIIEIDDEKDGDYKGDGGRHSRSLTAKEEEEDEMHWLQTVSALPKRTTITKYYVEMGYQMGPDPPPKEEPAKQNSPIPQAGPPAHRKSRETTWEPRMPKTKKRATSPPPKAASPFGIDSPYTIVSSSRSSSEFESPSPSRSVSPVNTASTHKIASPRRTASSFRVNTVSTLNNAPQIDTASPKDFSPLEESAPPKSASRFRLRIATSTHTAPSSKNSSQVEEPVQSKNASPFRFKPAKQSNSMSSSKDSASFQDSVPSKNSSSFRFKPAKQLDTEAKGQMGAPEESSASSSSMMPPPSNRRSRSSNVPLPGPRFGPKPAPRCETCMRMRKACDRKSPCGRCSNLRNSPPCVPYGPDL